MSTESKEYKRDLKTAAEIAKLDAEGYAIKMRINNFKTEPKPKKIK